MFWRALGLSALVCFAGGCHSALGEALDSFQEARYPAAAAQFRDCEFEFRSFSPRARAHYSLYRGLTHLALGDARSACRWLGYAKSSEDRDPNLFNVSDRGALLAAWRSMGRMPGEGAFRCDHASRQP